ncbi:MAG TPA: LuxR C-terminal-related transcriptional regulator [Thermoanaerobaculia bacterium]|nr:LuxR C-terminal-related transcriptional regulator [Thermoanaerobaculia bacterium]
MSTTSTEMFEQITARGEAAFALDRADRIIFWNDACARLLGFPADQVMGRFCYDVLGGRDGHGNVHCYRNCPVMHQVRTTRHDVNDFPLSLETAFGERDSFAVSIVTVPAERPHLTTIIHVLQPLARRGGTIGTEVVRSAGEVKAKLRVVRPGSAPSSRAELTRREKEILHCMAQGMTTARIAASLCISPITVRNHVQKILDKLDVHTKFAAVAHAYQSGLIEELDRTMAPRVVGDDHA